MKYRMIHFNISVSVKNHRYWVRNKAKVLISNFRAPQIF